MPSTPALYPQAEADPLAKLRAIVGQSAPAAHVRPTPPPALAAPASAAAPTGPTPKGYAALKETAIRAAQAAGVPVEWATSPAFIALIDHESGWNPNAKNPGSTAYGLGQFLDTTWKGTGVAKTSDPYQQLVATFRYIKSRWQTPENAWAQWNKHKAQGNAWY